MEDVFEYRWIIALLICFYFLFFWQLYIYVVKIELITYYIYDSTTKIFFKYEYSN